MCSTDVSLFHCPHNPGDPEETHQTSSTDDDDITDEFKVGGAMVDFDFPVSKKRRRVEPKTESRSASAGVTG